MGMGCFEGGELQNVVLGLTASGTDIHNQGAFNTLARVIFIVS